MHGKRGQHDISHWYVNSWPHIAIDLLRKPRMSASVGAWILQIMSTLTTTWDKPSTPLTLVLGST